jgi:hypothetical protein
MKPLLSWWMQFTVLWERPCLIEIRSNLSLCSEWGGTGFRLGPTAGAVVGWREDTVEGGAHDTTGPTMIDRTTKRANVHPRCCRDFTRHLCTRDVPILPYRVPSLKSWKKQE